MKKCDIRGGFILNEIVAALITSLDVIIVYTFLRIRKGKFLLALFTSFLNMAFPLLGFVTGEFSSYYFIGWSSLLSGTLLCLIGLHMILQESDDGSQVARVNPLIIALAVSVDTFSVSVSFGMIHMNKLIFIAASGLFTLILSYAALRYKGYMGVKGSRVLRSLVGVALIVMGVMSFFR